MWNVTDDALALAKPSMRAAGLEHDRWQSRN